jgi:hypothetical protein
MGRVLYLEEPTNTRKVTKKEKFIFPYVTFAPNAGSLPMCSIVMTDEMNRQGRYNVVAGASREQP